MNHPPKKAIAGTALFICVSLALALIYFYLYSPEYEMSQTINNKILISGCHISNETSSCQITNKTPLKIWSPSTNENDFKLSISRKHSAFLMQPEKHQIFIKPTLQLAKDGGIYTEVYLTQGDFIVEIKHSNNQSNQKKVLKVQVSELPDWQNNYQKIDNDTEALSFLKHQLVKHPEHASTIYFYLSRLYLRKNNLHDALDSLTLSNQLLEKEESINRIIDNKTLQVYILLFLQDKVIESQNILVALPKNSLIAESNYYRYFYQANLYSYMGEYRQAQQLFQKAENIANIFNLTRHQIDAQHMYTRILVNSGNFEDAITKREQLITKLPASWGDCRKAIYYIGLGWAKLKMLEASSIPLAEHELPFESLNLALKMLEDNCPNESPDKINVLLNLAKSHYLIKNTTFAGELLLRVEQINTQLSYRQKIELTELKGLLALTQNSSALALSYFQQLKQLAEQVKYSDFYLVALVGIADSYQQSHFYDQAIKNYSLAERVVFDNSLSVPIIGSQEIFLESKLNFSYRYVGLLHQLGRDQEALNVARRFHSFWLTQMFHLNQLSEGSLTNNPRWSTLVSRMKSLRKSIIAQQSLEWSLPYDQLETARIELLKLKQELATLFDESLELVNKQLVQVSPLMSEPANKELFLFFYPINEGWLGFAKTQQGLHTYAINSSMVIAKKKYSKENAYLDTLVEIWLEHFQSIISQHELVKIFPFGDIKDVNFNHLMFNGKKLIHQNTIVYGVDLKREKDSHSIVNNKKRSLIVANTLGDLRATENEAKSIINTVKPFAWQSTLLLDNNVTIRALQQQLTQVSLFHYAGHVSSSDSSIADHEIPLANNVSLKTRDILLLPQVPKWVVLSACNSSGIFLKHQVESIGLAHAFVIAGSEFVIATNQPVKDDVAEIFMTNFYQNWMSKNDFIQAVRQTQIDLMNTQPEHDWLAFRVITI